MSLFPTCQGLVEPGLVFIQWTWLDTRLGLKTDSETDQQFKDTGKSMEVIYSGSDPDFEDEKSQQAGTGEVWSGWGATKE